MLFLDISRTYEDLFNKVCNYKNNPNTYRKQFGYNLTKIIIWINARGLFSTQLLKEDIKRCFLVDSLQ